MERALALDRLDTSEVHLSWAEQRLAVADQHWGDVQSDLVDEPQQPVQ
jgi:hypothetical protein